MLIRNVSKLNVDISCVFLTFSKSLTQPKHFCKSFVTFSIFIYASKFSPQLYIFQIIFIRYVLLFSKYSIPISIHVSI
ncbi:unnamed protein product [Meloidogyne enterolobii]|uniref:Uncharacterized protein n=1 Tax=Meloidogyne enterolobii TaxID=390850 RepID=A0ACB0YQK7_MELEN